MRRTAAPEKLRGGAPAHKVRPRDHEYRPLADDDQELDAGPLVPAPRVDDQLRRLNGL